MKLSFRSFVAVVITVLLTIPVLAESPSIEFDQGELIPSELIQNVKSKALELSTANPEGKNKADQKSTKKAEQRSQEKTVRIILRNGAKIVEDEIACKIDSCDPKSCSRQSTANQLDSGGIDALFMNDSFNKCVEGNFPLSPEVGIQHNYKTCNGSMCYSCRDVCNSWKEVEVKTKCKTTPPGCEWEKKWVCNGYTHECNCTSGC